MNQSEKKDILKNKFHDIEKSVDPEIKFTIDKELLKEKEPKTAVNTNKHFFWSSIGKSAFKIVFLISKNILGFAWKNLTVPFFNGFIKIATNYFRFLKEKKEKQEVAIGEYLKTVESKLDIREAKLKIEELEAINISEDYEKTIRKKFDNGICSVTVNSDKVEYSKASKSLTFDLEIFDFLATKLNESQLVSNIDYMTVSSTVEKLTMFHVVEFELKVAGQNWAMVFSKFISSQIYKKIENLQGKMDGHHYNNVTQLKDTFVFCFSHQRLELHEAAENIKKFEEKTDLLFGDSPFLKQENYQDI